MIAIKGYTEEQLKFLIDNFVLMTNKQLAEKLDKSVNSISYAARQLQLIKQPHKPWTDEEEQYLKEHYIDMTSEELAKKFHRTVASINARRDELKLIRNSAWSDEEIRFLQDNYLIMQHSEIGKKLGRTTQAITAKCFDLNLYKKEVPWEEWEEDYLKKNYMEMTTKEIAKFLNRSPDAVSLRASRMGMKKYSYYCDYHYFDVIDTEEKAYWLGFLTADGWISKNKESGASVVGVELQYGDIGHLKKLNKSLQGNYKITDRWKKCNLSKHNKLNHICALRIFSATMYNSLVNLGFDNNKSFTAGIPNLPQHLYKHFMRGYFDGDGCFSVSNKRIEVGFCMASKQLKEDIMMLLQSYGFDMKDYCYINEFNTLMYIPQFTSNKNKMAYLDWIYQDATIYLDRKYKKYLKAKQKYSSTKSLAS